MLIEKLIVRKTKPSLEVIREIEFNKQGLNLIVDNTTNSSNDTGNNIGKTTAIKIIDLCLGANSVRSLYYDTDTRSEYTEIRDFLKDNKVEAELVLYSKSNNLKKRYYIVRQLFKKGKRKIDGKEYNKKDFESELKSILFNSKEPFPTLRQLIPKFIRVNYATDESMIKFLSNTDNATYETIYLFLLNILSDELLSNKDILSKQLKDNENKLRMLENDENITSLDSLKQKKILLNQELSVQTAKRKELDYLETYKEELEKKREITTKTNQIEEQIQLLEFEIKTINQNIDRIKNEKSDIDLKQLKSLYVEAQAYLGDIDKTYDELVEFHNTMKQNRIDFISNQLNSKKENLEQVSKTRDKLLEEKKSLTVDMLDEGLLDELNLLNTKIEELNREIGEVSKSIDILKGALDERDRVSGQIKEINSEMDSNQIDKRITLFNKFFSSYCEKLYGEKYWFVYNKNWKSKSKFPVSLDSFKGNVGTGMEKAVILAFDLAYMKYAQEIGIKVPQFVIHDKMENTHINQLKTIFKISQDIEGQYIMPILRERISEVETSLIEHSKILELSSADKFFRV